MRLAWCLARNDQGQDLAEYGIALAVIAVGGAAISLAIGADVFTLWDNAHTALHQGGSH